MNFKGYIFIFITVNLFHSSCDPIEEASANCHKLVKIKNNSSSEIYFIELGKQHLYEDQPCNSIPRKIASNSSIEIEEFWDCWEEQIDKTYKGALVLKFLESDSWFIDCELPSTIPNELFVLTKEITTSELRINGWQINYP